jgi:hypothetical protein
MRIEYTKGERASRELLMIQPESSEASSGRKVVAGKSHWTLDGYSLKC